MKRAVKQDRKFLLVVLLTLVLIFAGIFMVFRVFRQYEAIIIENEDRQLLGLARSVDRSITSYLRQFSRDLEHTLRRDGLTEAEVEFREKGEDSRLIQQMEESILADHPLTYDMLCMDGGTILYSS